MPQNLISIDSPVTSQHAAFDAIRQIQSLPFLIGLSGAASASCAKMGGKSRSFVYQALNVAQQNPNIHPVRFDLDEFGRDVVLIPFPERAVRVRFQAPLPSA